MDALMKLSREAQVVLGGAVLLLIISFFDWQQVSLGVYGTPGLNEWRGIGFLAGLLTIALIAWEAVRLFGVKVSLGSLSDGLVSVGLALLVALLTVIYFLTHGDARHWPAWVGLLLAIVVAIAAVMRARAEGVQMPEIQSRPSGGSTGSSGGSTDSSASSTDSPGGDMGSPGDGTEV